MKIGRKMDVEIKIIENLNRVREKKREYVNRDRGWVTFFHFFFLEFFLVFSFFNFLFFVFVCSPIIRIKTFSHHD